MTNGIWQPVGLDLVNINMYAKFHPIFHSVQKIGSLSLFQNLDLGIASTDDKRHFAVPWVILSISMCMQNFINYGLSYGQFSHSDYRRTHKLFANWLRTDTQCDYSEHSESQTSASLSVDVLLVVQFSIFKGPFTQTRCDNAINGKIRTLYCFNTSLTLLHYACSMNKTLNLISF